MLNPNKGLHSRTQTLATGFFLVPALLLHVSCNKNLPSAPASATSGEKLTSAALETANSAANSIKISSENTTESTAGNCVTTKRPAFELALNKAFSTIWEKDGTGYCTSQTFNPNQAFKARISGLLEVGKYQEAIWLLNEKEDPQSLEESAHLHKKLGEILLEGTPTLVPKNLAGMQKKYLFSFGDHVLGLFKPSPEEKTWFADEKSEVTAYQLDQVLHLDLVPFTLIRKINNETGSLQYFFTDVEQGEIEDAAARNFGELMIFDYITGNIDRKTDNFLYLRNRDKVIGIDNGAGFKEGLECGKAEEMKTILEQFPKLKEAINCTEDRAFEEALAPLGSKNPILETILKRIHSLKTRCGRKPASTSKKL